MSFRQIFHVGASLTAILILSACAAREAPRPPAAKTRSPPPVVIRPLFPADYVGAAGSIDLLAIRSAELAVDRASDPRLKAFAQAEIADHGGTSAQLSLAGRRLNLVPPAAMRPAHQAMFGALSASGEFDSLYRRQQVDEHQAALKIHSDFAARGESPTLRPVARNAAAVVRRHLDQLRSIR